MAERLIRRRHLKSRNGCDQCKRRKIKCTEERLRPCGPCIKSRYSCSFVPKPRPVVQSNVQSSSSHLSASTPLVASSPSFPQSNRLDLELLHHYMARTIISISDSARIRAFFATAFVEIALENDYLLHLVLALSAFHKARQFQDTLDSNGQVVGSSPKAEMYLLAGHLHHDHALTGFSQRLSDINAETCHSLFACSILLFITSLARPREEEDESENQRPGSIGPSWRISEWMNLIRGTQTILDHPDSIRSLRYGPMAVLFEDMDESVKLGDDVEHHQMQESIKFETSLQLDTLSAAIQEHSDAKTNSICQISIHQLRTAFNHYGAKFIFSWPMVIHRDYLTLLESKKSEALLVLAHYCVLLQSISNRWWIEGWPRHILEVIVPMHEDIWLHLLEWPIEKVLKQKCGEYR